MAARYGLIPSELSLGASQGVRRNAADNGFEAVTLTIGGLAGNQSANTVFAGPTSGGAAAPTFRALVAADIPSLDAAKITSGVFGHARLGTGGGGSTKFLREDGTYQTISTGLTIGSTPISSGTNGEFLYQASGVVSQTPRLSYDGTSVVVGDTVSRTSTEIVFKTRADGGFGTFTLFEQKAAGDVVFRDRFNVSVFAYNSGSEIWSSPKTFEIAEIRSSSRYLTPKLVGYNDNNRELNINQTGIAFRLTDASNNAKLLQMYSTAATAQLEVGYNTSNYGQWKVGSTGINEFNAVGSGAKFVFSDAVEVPDEAYSSAGWNGDLSAPTKNALHDHFTDMGWVKNTQTIGAPSASDDDTQGHSITSLWGDSSTGNVYVCNDPSTAAAVWTKIA